MTRINGHALLALVALICIFLFQGASYAQSLSRQEEVRREQSALGVSRFLEEQVGHAFKWGRGMNALFRRIQKLELEMYAEIQKVLDSRTTTDSQKQSLIAQINQKYAAMPEIRAHQWLRIGGWEGRWNEIVATPGELGWENVIGFPVQQKEQTTWLSFANEAEVRASILKTKASRSVGDCSYEISIGTISVKSPPDQLVQETEEYPVGFNLQIPNDVAGLRIVNVPDILLQTGFFSDFSNLRMLESPYHSIKVQWSAEPPALFRTLMNVFFFGKDNPNAEIVSKLKALC